MNTVQSFQLRQYKTCSLDVLKVHLVAVFKAFDGVICPMVTVQSPDSSMYLGKHLNIDLCR